MAYKRITPSRFHQKRPRCRLFSSSRYEIGYVHRLVWHVAHVSAVLIWKVVKSLGVMSGLGHDKSYDFAWNLVGVLNFGKRTFSLPLSPPPPKFQRWAHMVWDLHCFYVNDPWDITNEDTVALQSPMAFQTTPPWKYFIPRLFVEN